MAPERYGEFRLGSTLYVELRHPNHSLQRIRQILVCHLAGAMQPEQGREGFRNVAAGFIARSTRLGNAIADPYHLQRYWHPSSDIYEESEHEIGFLAGSVFIAGDQSCLGISATMRKRNLPTSACLQPGSWLRQSAREAAEQPDRFHWPRR